MRIDGCDVVLLSDETTLTVPYDCRHEAEVHFPATILGGMGALFLLIAGATLASRRGR